jgi:hypothetical protein
MKKLAFLLLLVVTLASCNQTEYPIYKYGTESEIPDSLKVKYSEWVTETVKASNNNMTGGDYEDPEDVIAQAEITGHNIFSVEVEGMYITECSECMWDFTPVSKMTPKQLIIFNRIKENR